MLQWVARLAEQLCGQAMMKEGGNLTQWRLEDSGVGPGLIAEFSMHGTCQWPDQLEDRRMLHVHQWRFLFFTCSVSRALFCSTNFIAGLSLYNMLAASRLNVIQGQIDLLVDSSTNISSRWYNTAWKHLWQWKVNGFVANNSGHGTECLKLYRYNCSP